MRVAKNLFAVFVFLLAIFVFAPPTKATLNINTDVVKKSVVFIYAGDNVGNADPNRPMGTGFFVIVPLLSDPSKGYLLLVTARHVVDPAWAHCPDSQPQTIYLRLNTKNYDPQGDRAGFAYIRAPIMQDGKPRWVSSDDSTDVAVFLLDAKVFEPYDFDAIPISDFATEQEATQRRPTDQVISAGLLLGYSGVRRNYPVLQFGHISTQPDEQIAASCVKDGGTTPMKLWLLSISLMPGSSGSPIFYVPEGANNVSFAGRTTLIGLQSISYIGFDVSGVTPVQNIFETITAMKLLIGADFHRGLVNETPTTKPGP